MMAKIRYRNWDRRPFRLECRGGSRYTINNVVNILCFVVTHSPHNAFDTILRAIKYVWKSPIFLSCQSVLCVRSWLDSRLQKRRCQTSLSSRFKALQSKLCRSRSGEGSQNLFMAWIGVSDPLCFWQMDVSKL